MKTITTEVIKLNQRGINAVTFKKSFMDLPTIFRVTMTGDNGYLDDGVRVWSTNGFILMVDDHTWNKCLNCESTLMFIGVAVFPTPIEVVINKMGMGPVRQKVSLSRLCEQLEETYAALDVDSWIRDGIPAGIRTIVANRYGYELNSDFMDTLDRAIKIVDEWDPIRLA